MMENPRAAAKRRTAIIELLRKEPNYSGSQLAKLLNVSSRTISRDIDKLKTEGKLRRVGDENMGHWEVL